MRQKLRRRVTTLTLGWFFRLHFVKYNLFVFDLLLLSYITPLSIRSTDTFRYGSTGVPGTVPYRLRTEYILHTAYRIRIELLSHAIYRDRGRSRRRGWHPGGAAVAGILSPHVSRQHATRVATRVESPALSAPVGDTHPPTHTHTHISALHWVTPSRFRSSQGSLFRAGRATFMRLGSHGRHGRSHHGGRRIREASDDRCGDRRKYRSPEGGGDRRRGKHWRVRCRQSRT